IHADLDRINAITDAKGVLLELANFSRSQWTSPLGVGIKQDDKNPEVYIGYLAQDGLGLPDRDMYDAKNKQFGPLRDGYKKYLSTVLDLAGVKDADKHAAAVYALEEKIAKVHWTRIEQRDPCKTY